MFVDAEVQFLAELLILGKWKFLRSLDRNHLFSNFANFVLEEYASSKKLEGFSFNPDMYVIFN